MAAWWRRRNARRAVHARAKCRWPWSRCAPTGAQIALAACVSGPSPRQVADARLDTPLHTLEAFQTYLRGDLIDGEFRCLSRGFKQAFQPPLSFFTYAEARERLAHEEPWFKLFASAEVVAEEAVGEGRHRITIEVAGRTWRVNLVREDFFRIWWGPDLEEGGSAPLEEMARVLPDAGGGTQLVISLPVREPDKSPQQLTSATVERLWKIDSVEPLDT